MEQFMRAAVCYEFKEPLVLEDVELAAPAFGEVQVDIKACAICHSDIAYMDGIWGGSLPAVYGHEAAGLVSAVGQGVTNVKPGDPVIVTLIRHCGTCHYCSAGLQVQCETELPLDTSQPITKQNKPIQQAMATGAFAEAVTVHASQVVAIPESLNFDIACLLACGVITGLGAVSNTVDMPAGSTCAIIGCGGVGLNSVQGAAMQGAKTIIAIDREPEKLTAAESFGATHTLIVGKDLAEHIKALTNGRGLDYVFVTVGISAVMDQAHDLIAPSGTVVLVGMPAVGEVTSFDASSFAAYGQKVVGSKMGSAQISRDIPALIDMYQQGRLKLDQLISNRYSFDQINEAIADARAGKSIRNVLIFD